MNGKESKMEVRKSKFDGCTKEEKHKYLMRLKQRIKAGYLDTDKVLGFITDKLAGCFDEELAKY